MGKQLKRSMNNRVLGGVCAGLAEYFDLDTTLVRAIYAIASVCIGGFPGVLIYIILLIVMPKDY